MLWKTRTLSVALSLLAVAVDPAIAAPARPAAAAASTAPSLALLPFADRTDGHWWLWTGCSAGEAVSSLLADSLSRRHGWVIADTARITASASARQWPVAALDDDRAAELAREAGAEWVVTGTVTALGVVRPEPDASRRRWGLPPKRRTETARVALELRVLDAASGSVRRSELIVRERLMNGASSAHGSGRESVPAGVRGTPLGEALGEVVSAAAAVLEQERRAHWSARVLRRMRYGLVELDIGRAAGLARGDRLTVWRTGLMEIDPATGAISGGLDEIAAELVVTGFTLDGRRAVARVVRGEVAAGDLVRPTAAFAQRAGSDSARR